ncbi:MAG: arylamine N-acetyltransferase [Desulfobacterales bacterium]|nr:arylamine N-acetyltransferase [Desulfobacterales bacterium]
MTSFDCEAYFKRIGYTGSTAPTLETLRGIHHAQLYTIPFENFDILMGLGISLDSHHIFKKLVRQNRGGYCFELSGLFFDALTHLGFTLRPLLARVHKTDTPTGRGHRIECITLEGKEWIADVGHGADTPRCPLPLEMDTETSHGGLTFRLKADPVFNTMVQVKKENQWENLYSFDRTHVCQGDIDYGNHYTATHPDSIFTQFRVAVLPVEGGNITLFDTALKQTRGNSSQGLTLEEGREYLHALKTHFNIELPQETAGRVTQ